MPLLEYTFSPMMLVFLLLISDFPALAKAEAQKTCFCTKPGASQFGKNADDWKSRLNKQSKATQASIEFAQTDLIRIAPEFYSEGILHIWDAPVANRHVCDRLLWHLIVGLRWNNTANFNLVRYKNYPPLSPLTKGG